MDTQVPRIDEKRRDAAICCPPPSQASCVWRYRDYSLRPSLRGAVRKERGGTDNQRGKDCSAPHPILPLELGAVVFSRYFR
jgi:hypothetical protein